MFCVGEKGDLSDLQKGQIVGAHLTGSVTLTAQLFDVLNSLYDYDCVHKAWQDFIREEE